MAQVLNARALGANLYINGDLSAGSQLNLTDQDDTVTITGNLIGGTIENNGDYYSTLIDLKDGNDTLTVGGGKVIAGPDSTGNSIQIQGGDGDKTLNFTNGLENNQAYLSVFIHGSGNHTINITGDLLASSGTGSANNLMLGSYSQNDVETPFNNIINISGSLIVQDNSTNLLHDASNSFANTNAIFHISGDIKASNGSSNFFAQTANNSSLIIDGNFIAENMGYNQINYLPDGESYTLSIGGDMYTNNMSNVTAFFMSQNTSFTVGSIITDHQSNVRIEGLGNNFGDAANFMIINGNIEALNGSTNTIYASASSQSGNASNTFEVNGEVIARGSIEVDGYTTISTNNIYVKSTVMGTNSDSTLTFLSGFTADSGSNVIELGAGNDDLYIEGDINAMNAIANGYNSGTNTFNLGEGDDLFTLIGNVTASNGGLNTIYGGAGDDIISLKGHIDAGSLNVYGGDGNDTLILTATTQARFEADYKEWLTDLASSGNLADSGIETIQLDVRTLQTAKLGWLIDLVDQANADGAHITLEDNKGNVITEPQLYLSFNTTSEANPIDALLDEYTAVVEQSVAPKAANVADVSHTVQVSEAHEFAVNFANNNYSQDLEQYATTAIVA